MGDEANVGPWGDNFFWVFLAVHPMHVETPKNAIKKWGGERLFQDFLKSHLFDISHHYPNNMPKNGQGGGNGPASLFRCKNQCQNIMGQNPHGQGLAS